MIHNHVHHHSNYRTRLPFVQSEIDFLMSAEAGAGQPGVSVVSTLPSKRPGVASAITVLLVFLSLSACRRPCSDFSLRRFSIFRYHARDLTEPAAPASVSRRGPGSRPAVPTRRQA